MLTSEKAALTKVTQLYKQFKSKKGQKIKKYKDIDFGPKTGSGEEEGSRFAMYKTGEIPRKGYPNPKKVEWVFAEALCDPGEVPQFVDDGVACDDCV